MTDQPVLTQEAAGPTAYLVSGPEDGPLMVFLHGWPAIAATWRPQLTAFAALGYRVVAPDIRGFGDSAVLSDRTAYAQRHIVDDALALLRHLDRGNAIWVGHDWGCATVWALAAHHPAACTALVNLCVPYRTLERGKARMLAYVNRDIYPVEQYPDAQFDYMTYYQNHIEDAVSVLDAQPSEYLKVFYRQGNPEAFGEPSRSATVVRDGGWFGGSPAPDLPLDTNVLDEALYSELHRAYRKTGFAGNLCVYRNDDDNLAYSNQSVNGGRLDMPVLFVEARNDAIADTAVSRLSEPMREFCGNLTEVSIQAGHWVALERPHEVNDAIAEWLPRAVSPTQSASDL